MVNNATPIKDVAGKVIKDFAQKRRTGQTKIQRAWKRAAGRRIAAHTEPVSLRHKRLVVNVDSSAWLYELAINKRKITKQLKNLLRQEYTTLSVRIGRVEKQG